jgi:hypothetical protein
MKTLAKPGDKAEILRRLRTVRPSSTRRWGRMSAHQMVCHLSDSFLAVTGRKAVSDASGPLQRTIIKAIALYGPVRWPPGVLTRPEIDQELGGTKPFDFDADVAQLEALVEQITAETKSITWHRHPIFGTLSDRSWLRWAYLHMDHHLRQFGA